MRSARIAGAAATLLLSLSCGQSRKEGEAQRTSPPVQRESPVRITQLYATKVRITHGEKTMLCYGVENAKSVRFAPVVADVWPAMARCVEVAPAQTTTYTFTAEDASGHSASQSIRIEVGAPGPKIVDVTVNKLSVSAGELVTICYEARNANHADISPGEFKRPPDPNRGCFSDRPRTTTTYRVKVTGAGGQADTQKVTVTVH